MSHRNSNVKYVLGVLTCYTFIVREDSLKPNHVKLVFSSDVASQWYKKPPLWKRIQNHVLYKCGMTLGECDNKQP